MSSRCVSAVALAMVFHSALAAGQCAFDNVPVDVGSYWDASCEEGMLGCNGDGKNVQCRLCGAGDYLSVACPPSSCSFPNEPFVSYYWDSECKAGELGCWADGVHEQCRFCGDHPFTGVPCPEGAAPPNSASCTFENEPESTYYWEPGCQAGMLGCKADGENLHCRFCGTGAYEEISCPSSQVCSFPNEPTVPYFWDPECSSGGLGCNADGIHAECRFCGVRPFQSVACPGARPVPEGECTWPQHGKQALPYYWDPSCEMGLLGCWADGAHAECRYCGSADYESVPCPETATFPEQKGSVEASMIAFVAEDLEASFGNDSASEDAEDVAPKGAGTCEFANVPVGIGYFWDPTCKMGDLGCDADGKNIECRMCGAGDFVGVPCPASSCRFAGVPSASYYWDTACTDGRLGCLADGLHLQCRFCGEAPYESVPCPADAVHVTPRDENSTCTFASEPEIPYYVDPECEAGMLGCNAGGSPKCRFCGKGAFADVECPASKVCQVDASVPHYWEPSCTDGMSGCNADGRHLECRYCGRAPYEECPLIANMTAEATPNLRR